MDLLAVSTADASCDDNSVSVLALPLDFCGAIRSAP
jgi:hypothetical protein